MYQPRQNILGLVVPMSLVGVACVKAECGIVGAGGSVPVPGDLEGEREAQRYGGPTSSKEGSRKQPYQNI